MRAADTALDLQRIGITLRPCPPVIRELLQHWRP
jgi:hypothetical protein